MLEQLTTLFNDYWSWLLGLLGLAGALSWLPGGGVAVSIFSSLLRIFASAFETISPAINGILQGTLWVWNTFIWETIKDVSENIRTAVGSAIIISGVVFVTYIFSYGNNDIKYTNLQNKLNICRQELSKSNQVEPATPEIPLFRFPWQWF